jgi:NADH dehydrogenase (ubiquinone) 1 beta subcomplex subunit 9
LTADLRLSELRIIVMSVPTGLVSHTRKVQSLYKRALRCLEAWYDRREIYRYYAVLMRERFDQNKDVKDMRIAKELITQGEQELFDNQHWHPRKFPDSPGGVAYQREVIPPDWVVDYWHPLEKAQYPEYFARREQRKREYIKLWEKKFGKTQSVPSH